ncbi:2-oxoglutarate (2OG) and Fe(II)-dependent oxygenase superfamily protein [Striga hermonthica]|uniref:2-oxoglutarate (2OG) and Fe(II)-dependent oxygenase superfamily protein n=1 Tax=Striga hermonthica TaxID=68872 RepID=A0A9N7R0W3_STRHE|nr:2-oxoglutarate (2OG) and Fe(II)-dependent oxygenase superfamily protein [Striga hermonthica]
MAAIAAAAATITSVKQLSESPDLESIPPNYAYYTNPTDTIASDSADCPIPILDLSLLTSDEPQHRSRAVQALDKACREWGFFMVVNHGIPEAVTRGILEVTREFFDLPEEEKPEFQPKNVLDPIRYGTSFNTAKEEVFCWRDFLKVFVHPHFHCPRKPDSLRELLLEYCERTRDIVRKLVRAISESLSLQEKEMERALDLDSTLQIFIANLYPRCPNPEMAMGMPSHSDHGLFTLLIENRVSGLQIQHQGKWINVNALPNSILVNTGDHLEIFSNGRYKSVVHRAVVNNQKTRISIAMANGPSPETVVSPATSVLRSDGCVPAYVPMKYKDYLLSQQSNQLKGKSVLKNVQIQGQ